MFTHLAATLNGLSTIRANNAELILKSEFDYHQDTHTSCAYMYIITNQAFGLALDLLSFLFQFCIIYFYMFFDTGATGDKIGLAITQAMSLTTALQTGVRSTALVSNMMMSVERILEYRDLEPESESASDKLSKVTGDWPDNGSIEFHNVIYRYSAKTQPVLREISLVINSREKIGIVGRTGAGN